MIFFYLNQEKKKKLESRLFTNNLGVTFVETLSNPWVKYALNRQKLHQNTDRCELFHFPL